MRKKKETSHCPHCGYDVTKVEETEFGIFCPKGCGDFWRSETISGDELPFYVHDTTFNMMIATHRRYRKNGDYYIDKHISPIRNIKDILSLKNIL
jgi:hypothetical protein